MYSNFTVGNKVVFPEFNAERHYMIPFFKKEGLPKHLQHWQNTVDAMLEGVETDDLIFFMADQGKVKKKTPHRRPGAHIDNYWVPSTGHRGGGGHLNPCLPGMGGGMHRGGGGHLGMRSRKDRHSGWCSSFDMPKQAIILASDVQGCKGYVGEWNGVVEDHGDCSHIDTSKLTEHFLKPHQVYLGDTSQFIHESVPVEYNCMRTLVRLNVNGWVPQ